MCVGFGRLATAKSHFRGSVYAGSFSREMAHRARQLYVDGKAASIGTAIGAMMPFGLPDGGIGGYHATMNPFPPRRHPDPASEMPTAPDGAMRIVRSIAA
ncbi:hypothetical protein [Sphingomonas sp. CROZ-RG-20F-R02-07]|uniref:hypothetical protein n=1 Tax=Sphingomonas sp. CROZ-RG-20F-R02-07 TaxID=2914832 RepID=UPI001F593D89|nr:hypothetical protein [Sphingomonas sp. CROZ-RG-20F-R02-07]